MEEKSRRLQRAEKEIREVISTYLMRHQSGASGGIISLTQVLVSPDLRNVKAYVCELGRDEVDGETLETLQSHAPEIQRLFNTKFRMKYCPRIRFFNDEGTKMMAKIDKIVESQEEQSD